MSRIIRITVFLAAIMVAGSSSAIAQPENTQVPENVVEFKTIELSDSWTTIQIGQILVVTDDRGDVDLFIGEGQIKAQLVEASVANQRIFGTNEPTVGMNPAGMALVIEDSYGGGSTYFGYGRNFDYTLVVISENVLNVW